MRNSFHLSLSPLLTILSCLPLSLSILPIVPSLSLAFPPRRLFPRRGFERAENQLVIGESSWAATGSKILEEKLFSTDGICLRSLRPAGNTEASGGWEIFEARFPALLGRIAWAGVHSRTIGLNCVTIAEDPPHREDSMSPCIFICECMSSRLSRHLRIRISSEFLSAHWPAGATEASNVERSCIAEESSPKT